MRLSPAIGKWLVMSMMVILLLPGISTAQETDGPEFTFTESKHNFGDIREGDVVEHEFEFSNTGSKALIISKVITTCGCTAPTWPREPVPPGEEGKIKIVFNATGKIGRQNKVITILSNASDQKERLFIVANVLPASTP